MIHNSAKFVHQYDTPFNDCMESLAVQLMYRNNLVMICEVYQPPNTNEAKFKESLNELYRVTKNHKSVFICGDCNYDLIKSDQHVRTGDFSLMMTENHFIPTILKPTRVTYTSSMLIDNIFVKNKTLSRHLSYIITDCMSDHYPCLLAYEFDKKDIGPEETLVFERRKLSDDILSKVQ